MRRKVDERVRERKTCSNNRQGFGDDACARLARVVLCSSAEQMSQIRKQTQGKFGDACGIRSL